MAVGGLCHAAERPVREAAGVSVDIGALGNIGDFLGGIGVIVSGYFRNMENLHLKFLSGAVDGSVWSGWANRTLAFLAAPGTRSWWELNESAFSAEFRRFIAQPPQDIELPEAFQFPPPAA